MKKNVVSFSVIFCAVFFCSGCAGHILGTYVRQPPLGKAGHFSYQCHIPYNECFVKTEDILKGMDATLFISNPEKKYISAMKFDKIYKRCIDTTEVGIFFSPIDLHTTKVDVACGNSGLAKFVSEELFKQLP